MSKNEKQYQDFKDLLRGAICDRTQAQFAIDAGLSPEHLSRMLNRDKIGRPSQATLGKIASAAKNGITLQDLLNALDQEDGIDISNHPSPMRETQAKKDFAPEFESMAEASMKMLNKILKQQQFPIVSESIQDYADQVISAVNGLENIKAPICYEVGQPRDYFGHYIQNVHEWAPVYLSMSNGAKSAESMFIIYFDGIVRTDSTGMVLIQHADCSVEALQDLYGFANCDLEKANGLLDGSLPWPEELDFTLDQVKADNPDADPEVMAMGLASALPYSLDYSPAQRFLEKYHAKGRTAEERVIGSIFGEQTRWSETFDGFGFELDAKNPPEKLAEFLTKSPDKKYVLDAYDPDGSNDENGKYGELKAILESDLDSRALAEKLEDFEYQDPDMLDDEGWGSAIATAMRAGTGFPFKYHRPAKDLKEFPNLSEKGCVILDVNESDNIQREAIIMATCRYAKALGIKKFGDILFTGVHTEFRKPMSYVVKDEPKDKTHEECSKSTGLIEYLNFDRDDPEKRPKETGMYHVLLRDGRFMKMLWLKQKDTGAWIRAHKEWSDQVAKYSASAIEPEPDPEFDNKNQEPNS